MFILSLEFQTQNITRWQSALLMKHFPDQFFLRNQGWGGGGRNPRKMNHIKNRWLIRKLETTLNTFAYRLLGYL